MHLKISSGIWRQFCSEGDELKTQWHYIKPLRYTKLVRCFASIPCWGYWNKEEFNTLECDMGVILWCQITHIYLCINEQWGRVTYIRVSNLGHPVLAYRWLHCWEQIAVKFETNTTICTEENASGNVVSKIASILSRPRCDINHVCCSS